MPLAKILSIIKTSNTDETNCLLIKAFNNLGESPSQSSVDKADIKNFLKNAGNLQMKEFTLETSELANTFSKVSALLSSKKELKTIWFQFYLHSDEGLLLKILKKLLDDICPKFSGKIDVLWNVSYRKPSSGKEKNKIVVIFC